MFDLGWAELLVIGVVALIVVGPKDLPVLFRKVGQFVGKARGMAREFSRAMNDAADESGVRDVAKTFKSATNPVGSAFDGVKDAARDLTDIGGTAGQPRKPGAQTTKLSAEREASRRKIEAASARAAAERKTREADEAMKRARELEAALDPEPEAKAPAEKKDET